METTKKLRSFTTENVKALIDQAAEIPVGNNGVPMVGSRKIAYDLFFKKFVFLL